MNGTPKFDALFESVRNKQSTIVEKNFAPKTNPKERKDIAAPRRKKSQVDKKVKKAFKQKPIEHERRDMKLSRGDQRKRMNFIPKYRQVAHGHELPSTKKKLAVAKAAESGIWKLTKQQVIEIATKYEFNVPSATKRSKHLGSTGIVMWRKDKNNYYLVKLGKHLKDR